MSKGENNSGGDDVPLTSDSLLVTFGAVVFLPMTIERSQSTEDPSISTVGIAWGGDECGRGRCGSLVSCSFLIYARQVDSAGGCEGYPRTVHS